MQKLISLAILSLILIPFHTAHCSANLALTQIPHQDEQDAASFRHDIISFVRETAKANFLHQETPSDKDLQISWDSTYKHTFWSAQVEIYYKGQKISVGKASKKSLAKVLQQATQIAMQKILAANIEAFNDYRFKVSFAYPPKLSYSFIEFKGKGLELIGNRTALRQLDTTLLKERINASQHYLLRVMHPEIHGFFKKYNALEDKRSNTLRTIYTASSLYTFLKLYKFNKDKHLESQFRPIADYILSMQIPSGENEGGFYYSYQINTRQKACRAVVGTASKTIFTLIELYHFYKDDKYLNPAKKAGAWLVKMIKTDGRVSSEARCENNLWQYNNNQSFLYSGQVLSALSRLYLVSHDRSYYTAASAVAKRIVSETAKQNFFVGDDFRAPNTISTSWVTMALIDYAKINKEPIYRKTINKAVQQILRRQINNKEDIYNYGRYLDTMTTSGNGWINEVMSELYFFCQNENLGNCQQYKQAILLNSRWLLQNNYTEANSFELKNPISAIGGFMRNYLNSTVRTDAVCHGLNSLVNLMLILRQQPGSLMNLPERPIDELIGLLRIGNDAP